MKKHFILIVFIIFLALALPGCEDLKNFFGIQKEPPASLPSQDEKGWAPDKSRPFTVSGIVKDKKTGEPLSGAAISAYYTISCPTKECIPFKEEIIAATDSNGAYSLILYQNFWTIKVQKTKYSTLFYEITKESSQQTENMTKNFELETGAYGEYNGVVRDQGSRIIIDRGGVGGFTVRLDGKTSYFEFLIVINEPESSIYQSLLNNHNRRISFKGFIFAEQNNQGLIEITSFERQ